ncbi:MAG: hypothetical protein HY435_00425 [Candidatus Liptonbacteria bacterium]|nr:hypothetical protein [Candidatus Liptonbacteria bacterium]
MATTAQKRRIAFFAAAIGALSLALFSLWFSAQVFAASEGPNNADVLATTTGSGEDIIAWSNPANASTSNNVYATVVLNSVSLQSESLQATDFDFAIPSDATIVGIKVEVERKINTINGRNIQDLSAKIIKTGSAQGDEKAGSVNWSITEAYVGYGGETDLWGLTWTPAQINATDFGFQISAQFVGSAGANLTASIDHIRITVTYTPFQGPHVRIESKGSTVIDGSKGSVRIQ